MRIEVEDDKVDVELKEAFTDKFNEIIGLRGEVGGLNYFLSFDAEETRTLLPIFQESLRAIETFNGSSSCLRN